MRPLFRHRGRRQAGQGHGPECFGGRCECGPALCGHCADGAHGMFCEGCECWCAGDPEPREDAPARPAWWRRLSGAPARFLAYVGAGEPWEGHADGRDIADVFGEEVMPPGPEDRAPVAHMSVPRPGPVAAGGSARPGHPLSAGEMDPAAPWCPGCGFASYSSGPCEVCGLDDQNVPWPETGTGDRAESERGPGHPQVIRTVEVQGVHLPLSLPEPGGASTVTLAVRRPGPRPGPPAWQPPGAAGQYARHLRDLQRGLPAACGWVAAILDPRWQPRALEAGHA